jgi:hypothetical protein
VENAPIPTRICESCAQRNEDIIVESFLRDMESGANHPVQTSSTNLLNRVHGASGVLVEGKLDALGSVLGAVTDVNALFMRSGLLGASAASRD